MVPKPLKAKDMLSYITCNSRSLLDNVHHSVKSNKETKRNIFKTHKSVQFHNDERNNAG